MRHARSRLLAALVAAEVAATLGPRFMPPATTSPAATPRDSAKYPPERLQCARAQWVTGVPFLASMLDHARPPMGLVVAEAAVQARAASIGHASATLAVGLELRANGALLAREDWATYRRLLSEGASMPPGIGVCERCRRVLRTASRRVAYVCPRCHKRSTAVRREPWHLHVTEEERFDTRGQPVGFERRRYLVACEGCGERFWAARADKRTCSQQCKSRVYRRQR
jgi:hypothetical protein